MSARCRPRRSSRPGTTSSCSTTSRPGIARPCRRALGCIVGSYGDGATVARLLTAEGIEAIVHCAARSLVGESIADPARYFRDNVAGGITLLEAAREVGVDRVVFSSTAAVYGVPDSTPVTEDAPLRPINPYGETKRSFEGALAWYGRAYGLRSVTLRYFNVAGATDGFGEDHEPETHLIPAILRVCRGEPAGHDLRRRLPDPRRHLYPRLHPRRRTWPTRTCGRSTRRRRDDSRTAGGAIDLQPRQRRRVQQPRGPGRRRARGRPWHPARDRAAPAGRPAGPRRVSGSRRRDPGLATAPPVDRRDGRLGLGLAPIPPRRLRRLTATRRRPSAVRWHPCPTTTPSSSHEASASSGSARARPIGSPSPSSSRSGPGSGSSRPRRTASAPCWTTARTCSGTTTSPRPSRRPWRPPRQGPSSMPT